MANPAQQDQLTGTKSIGRIHSCGLWQCRYQGPVFRFLVGCDSDLHRSVGLRHSCAAAVEALSGGPSDGPIDFGGGDACATPVVCSATNHCRVH
jgi:hypothetical protein